MQSVTLNAWSSGFAAVRLSKLLRQYKFGLADAHRIAADFADGQRLSILFAQSDDADRFVEEVRKLNVDAFVSRIVAAAG